MRHSLSPTKPRSRFSCCKQDWKVTAAIVCFLQFILISIFLFISTHGSCFHSGGSNDRQRQLGSVLVKTSANAALVAAASDNKNESKFLIPEYEPETLNELLKLDKDLSHLYADRGDSATIYAVLASYRDNECVQTIMNIFETARYPNRLRLGVFQQHNFTDGDCYDFDKHLNCEPRNGHLHPLCGRFWQVKVDRIQFELAKGPMYGRYRAELFYQGEDFVLQVDAHTRFVPHWDNILVDMFMRTNNEMAVLTTYPKATIENDAKQPNWRPPIPKPGESVVAICKSKMLKRTHMFKHERGHYVKNPGQPSIEPFFAAGFSFARGHRLLNVPYDPYLPYLFDGEELSMSARLWTWGYDLYMPDRDIVYHIYEEHRKRPLFWQDDFNTRKRKAEKAAHARILQILQMFDRFPEISNLLINVDYREIDKYSLGTERTIEQYWDWIQMDWKKDETASFCKQISEAKMQRIPTQSDINQSR